MKTKDILLIGGGATIIYLLWKKGKKTKDLKNLVVGSATTGQPVPSGAVSNQPEQVYGLNLPSGMDLPVLTAGTGTPTEVAIQNGGVMTNPTPAIVNAPVLSANDSLGSIINVIPKDEINLPNPAFPVLSPCEQKWLEYSQTIKPVSQSALEIMKAKFMQECEGVTPSEPILMPNPVKFPSFDVKSDILPNKVEEAMIDKSYLTADGSKPRYIKARLFRGVM